jgi:hypothetical protein
VAHRREQSTEIPSLGRQRAGYAINVAREVLPYEEFFAGYDEASHQAVPGLLTALGLLGTLSCVA